MIVPVITLIAIFSILSLDSVKSSFARKFHLTFPLIGLVLIIIAVLRPADMPDYKSYQFIFESGNFERGEPAFMVLIKIVSSFWNNFHVMFFVMALFSISLNLFAIKRYSQFKAMSILFYLSNMFILHDMIQIRCAVAVAILLFTFKYAYLRDLKTFSLLTLLATLFHYSSIAFFIVYFLKPDNLNRLFYILLLLIAYIMCVLNLTFGHIVQYIPIPFIQNLVILYSDSMDAGNDAQINIFSIAQLIRTCLGIFLVLYSKDIFAKNKYAILFIKTYFIGIITYVVFSDFPVISFRISEVFQHCEFIVIPMILYVKFKPRLLFKSVLVSIAWMIFYINVFYSNLLL